MSRKHSNATLKKRIPASSSSSSIAALGRQLPAEPSALLHQRARSSGTTVPAATNHSLEAFQAALIEHSVDADLATRLTNTMRMITQKGGKKPKLIEPRRQKVKSLVMEMQSEDVRSLYNEYARLQVASERRTTYRLPVVEDRVIHERDEMIAEGEGNPSDEEVAAAVDETAVLGGMMSKEEEQASEINVQEKVADRRSGIDTDVQDGRLEAAPAASVSQHINRKTTPSPSSQALPAILSRITCDEHTNGTCTLIPVQNYEDFPIRRIQEVQADYYPSTRIRDMWIHRDENDHVNQVTADLDSGSVDHLVINDPRIITALGVREAPYDILQDVAGHRVDKTYKIHILLEQQPKDPTSWIVGELVSARHAYLYWLDSRRSADPKGPPTATEARMLARQLGRRAMDVMNEIERYWAFEQSSGGRQYRENREKYLGEDPRYPQEVEVRMGRSRWA
ncbi:hypothetical protein BDW02DRAFT_614844 [Decorospora gaudefroyi]|uniref:Uncharacterized protein n=1 Tax=Decorospora gaudefroyi TaxID=184978 RepID=A0A6A5JYQ8_9PLEO|nr:hypothetical protein BDW02DRAFT_614844 [Decorospora gaudefroyi]